MPILGTLRKLLGVGAGAPPPSLDPASGDETAARLREELLRGSWQRTAEFLESPEGSANWDDRAFYAWALSDWPGRPGWIEEWAEEAPESSSAKLVRGAHSVNWAWAARGKGLGGTVSQRDQELFLERLEMADADLYQAARLAPEDPTPWAFMITVAAGLGMELEEQVRRFEGAAKRWPRHLYAHSRLLNSLTEKWCGSHERMFEFARKAARGAPDGSPIFALVAQAHVERWLYYLIEEDDAGAGRYFFSEDVRDELREAADCSVLSPDYQPSPHSAWERGYFAFCCWMTGDAVHATRLFDEIGPWVQELPWGYLGKPEREFAKARSLCAKQCRGR